jgi:hypothetical protein
MPKLVYRKLEVPQCVTIVELGTQLHVEHLKLDAASSAAAAVAGAAAETASAACTCCASASSRH